jgi:type II secretory pathway component PulJ
MRRPHSRPGHAGYLLSEMMISIAVFSAISMGLLMGFVSLERNFMAATDFATNHTDAMRISDYLALDLRRALSVTTAPNDTTITIPAYYGADRQPQMPTLDGEGGVYYGSASSSVQIRYYLLGSSIYRRQGTDSAVAIADNVQDFLFDVTDSGKVVTTRVTFSPLFRSAGASAAAIAGTAIYNTTLLRNSRTDMSSSVY